MTTCRFNADLCCCRDGISVEGREAKASSHTCCGSFDEKSGDAFQNTAKKPKTQLDIRCEAENCAYNQERLCQADHIGIAGNGATQPGQTECATFKLR